MEKIDELLINQYAQDVVTIEPILERFNSLSLDDKKGYLSLLIGYFIFCNLSRSIVIYPKLLKKVN